MLPLFTSEGRKRYGVALEVRSCIAPQSAQLIEENSVVYVKECSSVDVVQLFSKFPLYQFIGFQIVLSSVSLEQMLLFLGMCR